MLPILSKRSLGTIVIDHVSDKTDDDSIHDHAIKACARELIEAIHSKDENGVVRAIKCAFEILESMPHEEYDHEEEE